MSHAFLITYYVSNTAARNIKYVWKAFRGCSHEPGYLANQADSCHEILSSAAKGHLKHRFDRVHISVRLSRSQTNPFRNRSSFSVGLLRSACAIVSIVSVFNKKILASNIFQSSLRNARSKRKERGHMHTIYISLRNTRSKRKQRVSCIPYIVKRLSSQSLLGPF